MDGRTQPPPTQAIYGTNAINAAYDPAGSVTQANSLKNNTAAGQNPASNDNTGSTPTSNSNGGKPVGYITSPWYHPEKGTNIAMGYVH